MLKLPVLCPLDVDHAINDRMVHMHALGPELSRQRLRECTHSELARREGSAESTALHGGRRRGEDEGGWVVGGGDRIEEEWDGCLGEVERAAAGRKVSVSDQNKGEAGRLSVDVWAGLAVEIDEI